MNTEAQVRAAKNPQEAMLAIARALDRIEAAPPKQGDTYWDTPWEPPVADDHRAASITFDEGSGEAEVEIAPPTEERKEQRRLFEQRVLKLTEQLGDGEDWTEAYAKGGPMWLYLANRDLVMSYPFDVRQALVTDVEQDSPRDAHEMGIDVLKYPGETGPGGLAMKLAEGNIG